MAKSGPYPKRPPGLRKPGWSFQTEPELTSPCVKEYTTIPKKVKRLPGVRLLFPFTSGGKVPFALSPLRQQVIRVYPAEAARQRLLPLQVCVPLDDDALGLRRAGTMHRLHQIPHCQCSHCHRLYQPQHPLAVFRWERGRRGQILATPRPHFRLDEIGVRGHRPQQPPGDVMRQTGDFVGKPGPVLLADVGQEDVHRIIPL